MNWDALTLYFRMECEQDDLASTRNILKSLEHPIYKIYCSFLSYVLDLVNKFNLEFQAEKPQLFTLSTKVSDLYRNLLRNFLKKEYIDRTNLKSINTSDPSNFVTLESMYFGTKAELLLHKEGVDQVEIHNFRLRALEFYIELSQQIKKRFNFSDDVLNFLKILDPKVAVSGDVPSIAVTSLQYFPNLVDNIENLNSEWRLLADVSELKKYDLTDAENFWSHVFKMKNQLDQPMFPSITIFIQGLLSLPHSSAAAERQFSQVSLLKTKIRNRLEVLTLDDILHTKELLGSVNCYDWEPSPTLLKRKINY